MTKPITKPQSNKFSSGPCAKRPGWNAEFLNKTDLLGRSHRSKEALNLINEVNALSFFMFPKIIKSLSSPLPTPALLNVQCGICWVNVQLM